MTKSRRWSAAVVTIGLAVAAGCQSSGPGAGPNAPVTDANLPDLSAADSARLCLGTARDFERQGYDREAIVQYERARGFDPGVADPVATRRLAVLYGRAGDGARATAAYDAALAVTPDDPTLLNDAGYYRLSRGDAAGAERRFRRAVAVDPHYARAWVNLGLALADQQRFDDSYAAFARALPPAQARANVGVAQARQGRLPEAQMSLESALAQDSTLPEARVALQWVRDQSHPPATRPAGAEAGTGA